MGNKHIGSNFDDFLNIEGIKFSKEEIIKNAIEMAINNKEFDENAGISYYDFLKYVNDNKVLCKYFESEEQDEKK